MARLAIADLVKEMLAAFRGSLEEDWPKARDYAKPELTRLAQAMVDIGKLLAEGKITEAEARSLLEIHKNTTRIVFLTIEGLGLIAVENAINAALGAVKETVNGALGFVLL